MTLFRTVSDGFGGQINVELSPEEEASVRAEWAAADAAPSAEELRTQELKAAGFTDAQIAVILKLL